MDVCGQHGDQDIAYICDGPYGVYCPACTEIEELKDQHERDLDELTEVSEQLHEAEKKIDQLEDELEKLKEEANNG